MLFGLIIPNPSHFRFIVISCVIISGIALPPNTVFAAEDTQSRLYNTREEQRDAGVKHTVTPWLILSGLAESEWEKETRQLKNSTKDVRFDDNTASVQIGADVLLRDWAKIELLADYDSSERQWKADEAMLVLEYQDWELSVGKITLPFGVYFSRFASGPALEFGETSEHGITLTYDYEDKIEMSVSAYRGAAQSINSSERTDWSLAIEAWPQDFLSYGLSYISDLADANENLLPGNSRRYARKVAAVSGYLLWVSDDFEMSLEIVNALRSFQELGVDRNRPRSWNIEFTYFSSTKSDWTIRLERSRELRGEPDMRAGIAFNYRVHQNAVLTMEALYGRFKNSLATDANGNAYKSVNTAGALLSVAF